jgi:hypothetical protein
VKLTSRTRDQIYRFNMVIYGRNIYPWSAEISKGKIVLDERTIRPTVSVPYQTLLMGSSDFLRSDLELSFDRTYQMPTAC